MRWPNRPGVTVPLGLRRQDYWSEVNPILQKWQNVNDASCPHCNRTIRVNTCVSGGVRCPVARCGSRRNLTARITWNVFTTSRKDKDILSTSASANSALSGLTAGHSSIDGKLPVSRYGWIWPLSGDPDTLFVTTMPSPTATQRFVD